MTAATTQRLARLCERSTPRWGHSEADGVRRDCTHGVGSRQSTLMQKRTKGFEPSTFSLGSLWALNENAEKTRGF